MADQNFISLSASKLNVLRDCPRCFYDANVNKNPQPRGIFPSLPGGIDRVMKEVGDRFRGSMPPGLLAKIPDGQLWGSVPEINRLRNWRSGLKATLQIGGKTVGLIGALDDLIVHANGTYSPYDTKTKGDVPKDDGSHYYQTQMDVYALLLQENGLPSSGKAYLDYHYPIDCDAEGRIRFGSVLYPLTTSTTRALETITHAVSIMTGGEPESSKTCEYCVFAQKRVEAAVRAIAQPALQLSA